MLHTIRSSKYFAKYSHCRSGVAWQSVPRHVFSRPRNSFRYRGVSIGSYTTVLALAKISVTKRHDSLTSIFAVPAVPIVVRHRGSS